MTSETSRYRPPAGSSAEERRAWAGFYARVRAESALATEVISQLDRDPELKRAHLALYLCCRESLRRHHAHEARVQRVAYALRWITHVLFAVPVRWLLSGMANSRDVALATLPAPATPTSDARHVRPVRHKVAAAHAVTERPSKSSTG